MLNVYNHEGEFSYILDGEEFEFKGLTTAAQAVLGGVYVPKENVDPYTKDVLQELQMPQAVRDLGPQTMEISMESYRNFWGKKPRKRPQLILMPYPLPL